MEYVTGYDVGDRKRDSGINEDSVACLVFEHGHRDGVRRPTREETDLHEFVTGTAAGEDGSSGAGDADDEGSPAHTRGVGVFALADGAGGYEAGDVASYVASTVVTEELAATAIGAARSDPGAFGVDLDRPVPEQPSAADLRRAVADAAEVAHRRILEYAAEAEQAAFTTLVAGIVVDGELHYGWVGDSRAYVIATAAGRIEQLTRDHSVVRDLLDAGRIDEVEAHVHPRGNEITNALGGRPGEDPSTATVDVSTRTVPLYGDDVVLTTSDGLVDAQTDAPALHDEYLAAGRSEEAADVVREAVVTDEEIRDVVLDAPSLAAARDELFDLANDRGGKDNLSLILLSDPTLPDAPPAEQLPTREFGADEPIEDRETVIVSDE